ncbi:hypothetical protein SteCoe_37181 [Stentor coeruleus]|uniref:Uncharacterized protein n=1 Tax=Stentor coeruleus TaxID=5963 RepID=A0A1R2ANW6_9CILI|nr:hypothetical protein SteCoe_37181 [Stentor coeruleus]
MGCSNSKNIQINKLERKKASSSNEFSKVREYYNSNESLLPNRIRELFQKFFIQQTSVSSVIDLKFINLSGPQVKSIEIILPYFTQIRALNLWKTKLGNEGCIVIAKLLHNFPCLSFISFADNRISYPGIKAICDKFSILKDLEILELHVNQFDAHATHALALNIGKLVKLRNICLDECEMSGDSLKELIQALPNIKELERISMDYNFFGEPVSNIMFNVLNKLKNLKRMSAQHTGITLAVQEALKKVYPDIVFAFS